MVIAQLSGEFFRHFLGALLRMLRSFDNLGGLMPSDNPTHKWPSTELFVDVCDLMEKWLRCFMLPSDQCEMLVAKA